MGIVTALVRQIKKWRETGPNGDATVIFRYATSTNNLVFYKPTQLGPTGVKLQWSQLDTASGGGFLYCNRSDSTSGSAMRIENAMVDSGKMYGSHKLFNTSVPRFVLHIINFKHVVSLRYRN